MLKAVWSNWTSNLLKNTTILSRLYSETEPSKKHSEAKLKKILETNFPKAKSISVVDISGGCGAMFEIVIESPDFKGLSIVKQHRMVNEALKEEIKDMHGIRIHTSH